jgi:hypothetical protein
MRPGCRGRRLQDVVGRGHAVDRVLLEAVEAEEVADELPVDGIRRPGKRATAERAPVRGSVGGAKPVEVARQQVLDADEVVAQRGDLCGLEVRPLWHDRVGFPLGERQKVAAEAGEGITQVEQARAEKQTRERLRSRAGDVDLAGDLLPDSFGEEPLDM